MILVPVPSPISQPVGCVRVENAIQVSGVRLMPAKAEHWSAEDNTVQNAQHGLSAYLAAILISALWMPTLLAASTPCFLNLWLTSPLAEYPSSLPQGTPAV